MEIWLASSPQIKLDVSDFFSNLSQLHFEHTILMCEKFLAMVRCAIMSGNQLPQLGVVST